MPPGRYPHKMKIQYSTFADADAEVGSETWVNLQGGTIWARIVPISGREFVEGEATGSDLTHHIYTRYRTGITPDRRLTYDSRTFNIVSAINIGEHNREMELVCKEGIN